MIIAAIAVLSLVVISLLIGVLQAMPAIPNTFMTIVNQILPHVVRGVKFVNGFMYPAIVWPLAGVCLALHSFWTIYRLYMWVVKKIPMFGVSD